MLGRADRRNLAVLLGRWQIGVQGVYVRRSGQEERDYTHGVQGV
jgi:hypothetical protein